MIKNDDLFTLVRSLTGNEKRHFKLYSGRQKGEKEYLRLFDALDNLKEYDEKEFRVTHKRETYLQNLTWRKHHLYETILASIESYHQSDEAQVHSLLHRAEILFEKTLYRQSLKTLSKAKAIVIKYEMFPLLFEALRWEEAVAIRLSDMNRQKKAAVELEEANKIFLNANAHKNMLNRIYVLHNRVGFFRTKKEELEIKDLLSSPLWKKEENAYSQKAKRYFHYSHFLYYFMKGNLDQGYTHCKSSAETFFTNPAHITFNPHVYMNAMNSLLYCCSSLHRYAEMKSFIDKFKLTKKYFTRTYRASALLLAYHELDYYSATGKLQDGFIAAKEIEKELAVNEHVLSSLERTGLLINLGFMYFMNEKFRETIALLNRVMSEPVLNSRVDMDSMVRLFFIIAHYERLTFGKPTVSKGSGQSFMRSLVRSAYRRMAKQKNLHKFEKVILNFIRKELVKADSAEELKKVFNSLRDKLIKLKKDPYESRPLEYFDLIAWLTGKIEGVSFAAVIRRQLT